MVNYIHHDTQGAALGYVLLPLRGVLLASFDTYVLLSFLALASGKAERSPR